MPEPSGMSDLDRKALGVLNMMIHILRDEVGTSRATLKGFEGTVFVDDEVVDRWRSRLIADESRLKALLHVQEVFREAIAG